MTEPQKQDNIRGAGGKGGRGRAAALGAAQPPNVTALPPGQLELTRLRRDRDRLAAELVAVQLVAAAEVDTPTLADGVDAGRRELAPLADGARADDVGGGEMIGGDESASHGLSSPLELERRTAPLDADPPMGPQESTSPSKPALLYSGESKAKLGHVRSSPRDGLAVRLKRRFTGSDGDAEAEALVDALLHRAGGSGKGANDAVKIVFDRVDGPVTKRVEVEGTKFVRKTIVIQASPELLDRARGQPELVEAIPMLQEALADELEVELSDLEE